MEDLEKLKYPIGQFVAPQAYDERLVNKSINFLSTFPQLFADTVKGLSAQQLATPYRDGGWTVKQVIHHIADSHMNAYIRFKLALTEDVPVIKPYLEAAWADLNDTKVTDIHVSLDLLTGIHIRWINVLKAMSEADFNRRYIHPQYQTESPLWSVLALYTWHSKHHHAHIVNLIGRKNWNT